MDINKPRLPSKDLQKIILLLKFDKNNIQLVGSSGTASNRYDTDYDLYSNITPIPTPEKAYNEIMKILDKTKNNPNIYFTEYKIQQKNNKKKTKFYDVEGLSGGGLFSYVSDGYQNIKNKVSSYFSYPTKLNNVSTKTLQQYGGQEITALNIYRTPIASMLDKVINLISLGTWEREKKNVGYDKLFHLALIATLKNGKNIVIEKNEVINISTSYKTHSDTEVFHIPLHNNTNLTIQQLIDKTKESISEKDFYDYSAFGKRNCQNFISNILKTNGLYNIKIDNFVFQDLTEIIKHMPKYVGEVADTITRTGAIVNKAIGGNKTRSGNNSQNYKNKEAFLSAYKNVEYLKIDFVVRIENIFRELSILYNLDGNNASKNEEIENSLKDDIHEYIHHKNYYKALKRLNSLYKIQGRHKDQIPVVRFFNTKVGEMYQTIANLKAIQVLSQNKNTDAKEKINMKDLHLIPNLSLIPKYIKEYNNIIQKEAKQLWTKLKPLKGQHISSNSAKKGIESLSVQQLRKAIKEYGLSKKMKGYTKLNKEELIKRLLKEGHIKMVGGGEGDGFIYNYILEPVFDWAVSKLWNGLKSTDYEKRDQMRKP